MSCYARLTLWLIGLWFRISQTASALGVFTNESQRAGLVVAMAATLPILLLCSVVYSASELLHFSYLTQS
jgi:hypothetical protein